jgi:hypothetical protein
MTHSKHREQLDGFAHAHEGSAIVVEADNWDLCLRTTNKVELQTPLGKRLHELTADYVRAVQAAMPKRTGQAVWVEPNAIHDLMRGEPTITAVNMLGAEVSDSE